MVFLKAFTLMSALSLASAAPFPVELVGQDINLLKRDGGVCYPQNMPIGVDDYNCPKKQELDSDGHCNHIPDQPDNGACTAYCEIRLTPVYGQEQPFFRSACQSSTTCAVANAQSITITNTYTFNLGVDLGTGDDVSKALTSAFNIGASYSYSESVGYTTTETFTKTLDGSTCGYWTFIPYMMSSCGSLTTSKIGSQAGQHGSEIQYCMVKGDLTDTPNYCNTTPYLNSDGKADGKVVFVYTDCATNAVKSDGQDPAYEYPGVSTGPK